MEKICGAIASLLVIVSVIPYAFRAYQRKVHPSLTSWSLWALIALVLLLTYRSSGAKENAWPTIFGFFNPFLIVITVMIRQGGWKKPTRVELGCIIFCILSLILWVFVKESKMLSQFALYLAILADALAAVPTINFLDKSFKAAPSAFTISEAVFGLEYFSSLGKRR
jgi:hypothetical protein